MNMPATSSYGIADVPTVSTVALVVVAFLLGVGVKYIARIKVSKGSQTKVNTVE